MSTGGWKLPLMRHPVYRRIPEETSMVFFRAPWSLSSAFAIFLHANGASSPFSSVFSEDDDGGGGGVE